MTRNRAGALLAAIGIVVLLSEWIRTTWFGHSAEAWVIAFGVILGFIGFYIVDPVHAEQGAKFIIDNATSVIQVVRTGRRATDPVVITTEVVAPAEPTPSIRSLDGKG